MSGDVSTFERWRQLDGNMGRDARSGRSVVDQCCGSGTGRIRRSSREESYSAEMCLIQRRRFKSAASFSNRQRTEEAGGGLNSKLMLAAVTDFEWEI